MSEPLTIIRDFSILESGDHHLEFKGDQWTLAVNAGGPAVVELYDQDGEDRGGLFGKWSRSQIAQLLAYAGGRWRSGVDHGRWSMARDLRLLLGAADREDGDL